MRTAIILSALAALTVAFPRPQDPDDGPSDAASGASSAMPTPTGPVTSFTLPVITPTDVPTPTNDPDTSSWHRSRSSKRPHWEPIPIFTKQCNCNLATARYPCWATDSLQRCNYEENFSYVCYMEAAGGCPMPSRVCSNLYQPTPKTGRHPCDLGPAPITTTDIFTTLPSSVPALPTANVSFPAVPSGNASWTVSPSANATWSVSPSANVTWGL